MMSRCRIAGALGLPGILWLLLAGSLTAGCGNEQMAITGYGPVDILEFPQGHIGRPSTPEPVLIAGPIALTTVSDLATIVSVRSRLNSGVYELVTFVDGTEFSRRRIGRIGENMTIVPLPAVGSATLAVYQSGNAGPLDVEFVKADVTGVVSDDAVSDALIKSSRFEKETGQLADPAVENMVPNSSFAADDEVRGTPADWFAYVETSTNVLERRLRVWGTAPGRRPYVATGPMRVEPGRRYRILVRLTVRDGAVALRVADYEELRVLVDLGSVSAADGPVERRVDFTASDADRAARIRFEPVTPGVPADFEITAIQMELLP